MGDILGVGGGTFWNGESLHLSGEAMVEGWCEGRHGVVVGGVLSVRLACNVTANVSSVDLGR